MTNFLNTDREIERYDEAELYASTAKPDMFPDIRSKFNVDTGRTDLMAPLPSGGFVTLASNAPDIMVEAPKMPGMGADAALPVEDDEFQLQSIRNFAASGANISSRDDYLAAGYTDQQIDASGVMGETQQKTGRTEPLSVGEIKTILREGGTLLQDYTPTMRENGAADLMETLMEISVDRRQEELLEQMKKNGEADTEALNFKIDQIIASERPEMLSLAENLTDAVFGNKNVLGTGVADFVTAGVMDMQEGYRMLEAGSSFNGGSATQRGLGILLIAAGVAEATGVGMLLGKAIKASIPKIQSAMVSMGQNAELRMAERGTGTTLNMGGDPMALTDPLVAAAGRAVGGDLSKQVDDARIAYEASPNDAALRKNYFELRRQRDADPVAKVEPPTDDTPGIIAFHGSAADFSEFKLEKIGTGEGAQAYGYGLYFADKEEIAKFYRDALREEKNIIQYNGKPLNSVYTQDVEDVFLDDIEATFQEAERIGIPVDRDDVVTVFSQLGQGIGSLSDARAAVDSLSPSFGSGTNRYLNFYDMVLSKKLEIPDIKGRVYKVGLTPKPEDLLDYDKPFSEQTPTIQAALKKAGYKTERNMVVKEDGDNRFGVYETNDDGTETLLKHFTEPMLFKGPLEKQAQDFIVEQNAALLNNNGAQILDVLASGIAQKGLHLPGGKKKDAERLASDALFKAGIPGIKYLDNTSRDGAGTSSNYVIFDDSMIKILEKYGIVGPVAISAMALSEDES